MNGLSAVIAADCIRRGFEERYEGRRDILLDSGMPALFYSGGIVLPFRRQVFKRYEGSGV